MDLIKDTDLAINKKWSNGMYWDWVGISYETTLETIVDVGDEITLSHLELGYIPSMETNWAIWSVQGSGNSLCMCAMVKLHADFVCKREWSPTTNRCEYTHVPDSGMEDHTPYTMSWPEHTHTHSWDSWASTAGMGPTLVHWIGSKLSVWMFLPWQMLS